MVMLSWLARRIIKDAWIVVGAWAFLAIVMLALALTGLGGKGLFERLEPGNAVVQGTESAEGQEVLDTLTGDGVAVSLLITGVDISTPDKQAAVAAALEPAHSELRDLVGEENVLDPFVVPRMLEEPAAQVLASTKLDGFLIVVTVDPNGAAIARADDEAYTNKRDEIVAKVETRLAAVPAELQKVDPSAQGIVSDEALMSQAVNDQVEKDLVRGEVIALPAALIIMVLVFGGFLAAGMPLLGGVVSIAATLGVLYFMSLGAEMQSFVVNIVSVIGLGLSIDYGLLITSRYREELARAHGQDDEAEEGRARRRRTGRRDTLITRCMLRTLATAGRTVLFSALTVAVSMLGLVLVGTGILRSIGLAGVAVVLISVAASLTLIPSVLVLLGCRLLKPSPLQRLPLLGALQRRVGDVTREEGVFSALARRVHARPWLVLIGCLALLGVLAAPVRGLHMLSSTTDLLPPASGQRTYLRILQEDYPAATEQDATLIIAGAGDSVTDFINDKVATTPGVTSVLKSATAEKYTVVYLDLEGEPSSSTAEQAVSSLRSLPAPADTWITGQAATQLDFRQSVSAQLPWVVGIIILATVVLLFLMTGSLLVPLKALIINTISLVSSLGVVVWVFQGGHGAGLLGFTPIGGVETYVVVTALGVGFGLAMDYEVFLLGRIKEHWDAGADNDAAVERGLQHSGRIVTSAALIMLTVFLGFTVGELLVVKEIGLALAVIVALDATVVRMLLVPATMTLLGKWNWWAPAPLQRLHKRYGLNEG